MLRAVVPAILLACLLAVAAEARSEACQALPIRPTADPSTFAVGDRRVRLDQPDQPTAPTVWEGPVIVTGPNAGPACRIDPQSLLLAPLAAFTGALLVLPSFSGSTLRILTLDLDSCTIRHASAPMSGPVTWQDGAIRAAGRPVPGLPCGGATPSGAARP